MYSTAEDSAHNNQAKRCRFCGAPNALSAHICQSCASPAPIPESVSYYSYFPGLVAPPKGPFDLDVRAMRREFLKMQQKVHPDHFSSDDKKRLVAESTSSLLNKAYTTLQQPLSRAEYLLSINGIEMSSEGEKLTDSDVLMTVMEAREQIEEAQTESDLAEVKQEAKDLIAGELVRLAELFRSGEWQGAKVSAVKLRYWQNIQKAAMDWEPGSEIRLDH